MVQTRKRRREEEQQRHEVCTQDSQVTVQPQVVQPKRTTIATDVVVATVDRILINAGVERKRIQTKSGWCVREGLEHVASVDGGRLLPLLEQHGPPPYFLKEKNPDKCRHEPTENIKEPQNCFQSLCRIVAGQQLAGAAAQSVWKRLLETTNKDLTPSTVLRLGMVGKPQKRKGINQIDLEINYESFQKPAGLSRAKARSIVHIALAFDEGSLSDKLLIEEKEEIVRQALLDIKGIGPWSCDMFFMFYLEKPNLMPLGDLGIRKGLQKFFLPKGGAGPKGSLCQVKDADKIAQVVKPYQPYQSLLSFYMWKVADTPNFYKGEDGGAKKAKKSETSSEKQESTLLNSPNQKAVKARAKARAAAAVVTP